MTLNEIAYQIAHSFDRGTDLIFIERIKDLVINERYMLIHREIDKYGINDQYIQSYTPALELVNRSMDVTVPSEYTILRTVNEIPEPIRFNGDTPFTFVGSLDHMVAFAMIKPNQMPYIRSLRYIGNAIKYVYTNKRIYIFNNTKLTKVLCDAVYHSLDVTKSTSDPTGICYKDNMEFPLAGDMINIVIRGVQEIIRNTTDAKPLATITNRDVN